MRCRSCPISAVSTNATPTGGSAGWYGTADGSRTPEHFYAEFLRGMVDIGYRGTSGTSSVIRCRRWTASPAGLEFADRNAQLAAEYLHGLLAEVTTPAVANT